MSNFGQDVKVTEQESPDYRAKGTIICDEGGNIEEVYVQNVIVDFEIIWPIDAHTRRENSDQDLLDNGWEKNTDLKNGITDWFMRDYISSRPYDELKQMNFNFDNDAPDEEIEIF